MGIGEQFEFEKTGRIDPERGPVHSSGYDMKPCPFCGKPAKLQVETDHHGDYYFLGCSDENCIAHTIMLCIPVDDMPISEAAEHWNRRS